MPEDREQLLSVAREVVSAGLRAPSGQERTVAALPAIREHVAPLRTDAFWVALIEHSINTLGPFLAVYGDELATKRGPSGHSESAAANLPLDLVNNALGARQRGRLPGGGRHRAVDERARPPTARGRAGQPRAHGAGDR